MKAEFDKISKFVKEAKSIAIVGHIKPDGDAVGSALAMKSAFQSKTKSVDVFFDGEATRTFDYIEGFHDIKYEVAENAKFDLLIIVDMSTSDRMGKFESLLNVSKNIVCIDHHLGFNIGSASAVVSDCKSASCGEIVFDLLTHCKIKITKEIADCLYTAIATDTGCFLYPSTSGRTHKIAGELLDAGANFSKINYLNFRVYDRNFLGGLRRVLRNLKYFSNGKLVICNTFNTEEKHKLKHFISDMDGVMVSAFMSQDGKKAWRVSLRSHGDYNIEPVAKVFAGGGHKNASGFLIKGSFKSARKQIAKQVEELVFGNRS